MLEIKDLSFRYSRRRPLVLDGTSLKLAGGEIGILLGKNGSGKTTLFKNILGIEKPQGGSITFDGKDLVGMNRQARARIIAYVPQDIQFGDLCVYDTVLTGRMSYFGFKAGKEDHEAVEKILNEMGLADFAVRNASELSGGERQKVAIARALAQDPRFLIFDEPTGNLDIANEQLIIEEARKAAKERGIGILTSLHDLNRALDFGDRFFFMKQGKIVCTGGKETVTESVIRDVFDVSVSIIEIDGKRIILNGGKNT